MTPTHLPIEILLSVSPEIAHTYQSLDDTDRTSAASPSHPLPSEHHA
jgi:hypothetical protein